MRYEEPCGYTITDGETSATFGSASFPNIEGRWYSSSHVTTCNPINQRVGWELQSGFKRDCLRQDQIRYGFDSFPAQSSLFPVRYYNLPNFPLLFIFLLLACCARIMLLGFFLEFSNYVENHRQPNVDCISRCSIICTTHSKTTTTTSTTTD